LCRIKTNFAQDKFLKSLPIIASNKLGLAIGNLAENFYILSIPTVAARSA